MPVDHGLSNQRSVFLFLSCSGHYCLSSFLLASKYCIRLVYFITYCLSSLKISSSCKMSAILHVHEDYLGVEEVWRIFYICFLYSTAKLNKSFCYSHRWLHHFLALFPIPVFPLTGTAPARLQRSFQTGELVQDVLCILAVDNFLASLQWFHETFYSLSPSFSMNTSVLSVPQLVRTLKCAGFPKLSLRILSVDVVAYINKTNIEFVAISS